jgi:hypothetical protein
MGWLPSPGKLVSSTSWKGYTGPPASGSDFGPGASYRRADRYVGRGQPRVYPDPQAPSGARVYRAIADDERPLARGAPAGRFGGRGLAADPTGSAAAGSIDVMYGAAMAGMLGNVRIGLRPGTVGNGLTYFGDLGRLQRFHGAQTVAQDMRAIATRGNRSTYRGGMMSGLPDTNGIAGLPLSDPQRVLLAAGLT